MAIDLTCRCGWSKQFDEGQLGLTIDCPQCDRRFPITDDAAAFLNGNIGAAELSFADGVEVPDEPEPGAPRRPKAAGRPSARSGGASVSYRPPSKSRTMQGMRRQQATRESRAQWPIIVGIVVVIALVGFGIYKGLDKSDRKSSLASASQVAEQALRSITSGSVGAGAGEFGNTPLDEIEADFGPMRAELPSTPFVQHKVQAPAEGPLDEVTLVYHAKTPKKGYECSLDLVRQGSGWRIADYRVRKLNPSEL
ncbi:MAG: hypothetical protein AAF488_10155 [Planctomycetota bacterium]